MEQLLLLLSCALCSVRGLPTSVYTKRFIFVSELKPFAEAQTFCREHHTDLASVWQLADLQDSSCVQNHTFLVETCGVWDSAWLGLIRTEEWRWHWTLPDPGHGGTPVINWGPREPNGTPGELCAVMDETGSIRDTTCDPERSFICFHAQSDLLQYVLVEEPMSWRSAQSYCRQFHTDLASVRSGDESLQIQRLVPARSVSYIGLFKDPFAWADGSSSSLRLWGALQPDGAGDCVLQQVWGQLWDDVSCSGDRPFVCYDNVVFKQLVRVQVRSGVSVNAPEVKASVLEQVRLKLLSLGLSEPLRLQWKQQENGHVFQRHSRT